MQTSAQGEQQLEDEEGVVLRAYRDAVGVWTIGCGLTAASRVVKPKAGMVITRAEATAMLQKALRLNYEPAVMRAMVKPSQTAFDAGTLFHFNTGAIGRATWVKLWRSGAAWPQIGTALKAWNKGGGKVLPGLVARRKREFDLLRDGKYARVAKVVPPSPNDHYATIALTSGAEMPAVRDGFLKLGYDVGTDPRRISLQAARAFQTDHGLTVDGIIGRATLSTLQRMLDARTKAKVAAPVAVASVPAGSTGALDHVTGLPMSGAVVMGLAGLAVLYLAWTYRDAIAAKVQRPLPRVAAFLRSF